MLARHLANVQATRTFAKDVARLCERGDLILLTGPIASGKTTFTQAFADAIGIEDPVTSPSYVLQSLYSGTALTLNHIDLYRLSSAVEVTDLGLTDYLDESVTLVEWADRYDDFPAPYLTIAFQFGAGESERLATVSATGPTWQRRLAALVQQPS